ncbi:MAG: DUF1735 domain-containing protein [Tannerella sp.]|jgi:hypothetical protein|nr:DUF1735 domain-containing protein [Tannerella sp.]
MKKIILSIFLVATVSSCYEDYVNDYDEQYIYFPYQTDVRTFVVGEGMKFSMAANLVGVIDNREDRTVDFQVDNSLVNAETLAAFKGHASAYIKESFGIISSITELSGNEYSILVDGKPSLQTVIKSGEHQGKITFKADSAAFLSDASRTSPKFVIPLKITKVSSPLLFEGKETLVIGVRYENMLFGYYWHGGVTRVTNAEGTEVEVIRYPTAIPQSDGLVWKLTTTEPFSLTANAISGELNSTRQQMKLTLEANGAITVSSVAGATYAVEPDGQSSYNNAGLLQDRKIFLNYKYSGNGLTYHATDTLTFRNRIRDGVNETFDENPDKYK